MLMYPGSIQIIACDPSQCASEQEKYDVSYLLNDAYCRFGSLYFGRCGGFELWAETIGIAML